MATAFVYADDYLLHDTGPNHPERPDRLRAIMAQIAATKLSDKLLAVKPELAALPWIERVHSQEQIRAISAACKRAPAYLDPDTPVCPLSFDIALLAAGGVLRACDAVMEREATNAFCAVRPPGHHAESNRAMGFCLFNSIAIAARYLQAKYRLRRVMIVDWDVHHGNGTQEIFYRDSSVQYYSVHQFPLYPGTGAAEEQGEDSGFGTTCNIPLPPGTNDAEYYGAVDDSLPPIMERFRPEFLLISAGFDAHIDDPLAELAVTTAGFQRLTELVVRLANAVCDGRIVSVLEGGYSLPALGSSVVAHIEALMRA